MLIINRLHGFPHVTLLNKESEVTEENETSSEPMANVWRSWSSVCSINSVCLNLSLTTQIFTRGFGGREEETAPQPPNVLAPKALVLVGKGHGGEEWMEDGDEGRIRVTERGLRI